MGEQGSLVGIERKVRGSGPNWAGIFQEAGSGLQIELQEQGSVALRVLRVQIPYLGIFLEKNHRFHQILT